MKLRSTLVFVLAVTAAVLSVAACGHLAMMHDKAVSRPSPADFGTGPRPSAAGQFTATLRADQPLRPRRLQTVRVALVDAAGQPVDGATIEVGGGMPEHGHGLPTRPRVTRALGDGVYEIQGLRFNMGGWWELTLAIETPAGADVVTFNLDL
ncbi:MAG TPA: FixH family protein [Woeseiaceae bacterium]|nr:FixH family protein [Woeseiaceae bacterium]